MVRVDLESTLLATFRATLPDLYAFVARRVGGERALAEDLVQETWLRAVDTWRKRGAPREPIAWLKTTARHLLLNHLRTQSRRPTVALDRDPLAGDPTGAANVWSSDDAARVQWGLARLGSGDAELIEAFHLEGHSTRELAQQRGLSERAIEGRLHRARAKLRRLLGTNGATT